VIYELSSQKRPIPGTLLLGSHFLLIHVQKVNRDSSEGHFLALAGNPKQTRLILSISIRRLIWLKWETLARILLIEK
jgi:hypothetical protein